MASAADKWSSRSIGAIPNAHAATGTVATSNSDRRLGIFMVIKSAHAAHNMAAGKTIIGKLNDTG